MKKVVVSVASSLILAGCGTVVTQHMTVGSTPGLAHGTLPPTAVIVMGHRYIRPVMSGYSWSNGHGGSVADAAFDPVQHLETYQASAGEQVRVSFSQRPHRAELTMWENGIQVLTSPSAGSSIKLPRHAGHYICEITGYWGHHQYAHYDFEVRVH